MSFFCVYLTHVGYSGLMAIGLPGWGTTGLFQMIDIITDDSVIGILALVGMCCWISLTVLSIYLIKKAHALWKGNGGEQQLKKDATTAAIKSQITF